jgi:hypothetical protein
MGQSEPARDMCATPEFYRGDTFRRAYERLVTQRGRKPTIGELCDECELDAEIVVGLLWLHGAEHSTAGEVRT